MKKEYKLKARKRGNVIERIAKPILKVALPSPHKIKFARLFLSFQQRFQKWFIFFPMNFTGVIAEISFLTVVIGIAVSLLNKRIDDLRHDVDRRFQEVNKRIDELKEELREIRQLLYKVLEVPQKEDK